MIQVLLCSCWGARREQAMICASLIAVMIRHRGFLLLVPIRPLSGLMIIAFGRRSMLNVLNHVSVMAIIRSLFSDEEMTGAAIAAPADQIIVPQVLSEPAPPQAVEISERLSQPAGWCLDPCVKCRYRGLCDDDYCAMLMHPIDMPHAPRRRGWSVYGL